MRKHSYVVTRTILIVTAIIVSLSACSLFSPVKTEPTTFYVINTKGNPPRQAQTHKVSIFVTKMQSVPLNNSTDMVYTTKPHQVGHFLYHRWAEKPADMLEGLIVQTLKATNHFYTVGTLPSVTSYDYILNSQLIELDQAFSPGCSVVHLIINVELINAYSNAVVATQQFSVTEYAPEKNPYGGVIAANRAAAKIMNRIARFCIYES